MKLLVLASLACAVALSLGAPSASSGTVDKYIAPPTVTLGNNATKYLKHVHRATLNFACEIERITVTPNFDNFAAGFEDPISQTELEDHIGEPFNIEWAHVMQMYFATTDPRGQERQLGTLGGDLGEFLIVLSSIESQTNKQFSSAQVKHLFQRYLTVMSREKFYFSIDASAISTLKTACGCPQLNIADPPEAKKAILLNTTHLPDANGDEFFKKALADPETFGIRLGLIHGVLDAFYQTMWNKSDVLHRRIKFVLLKGPLDSKGFVIVKTAGYCNAQMLAPLVSPELCAKQMGVYHGDAAVLLRTEMAGVVLASTPEEKNGVVRRANELASSALTQVLSDHQEPVYTVQFEGY